MLTLLTIPALEMFFQAAGLQHKRIVWDDYVKHRNIRWQDFH